MTQLPRPSVAYLMFTGECSRGQCGLTGRSFCIQSDSDAGGGGKRVTVDKVITIQKGKTTMAFPESTAFSK